MLTDLINEEAVCSTAPATQGLLNIYFFIKGFRGVFGGSEYKNKNNNKINEGWVKKKFLRKGLIFF